MKKLSIFFFALCFSTLGFSLPIQNRHIDPAAFTELKIALNIPVTADIIAYTQEHWLRPSGKERWEMTELSAEKRALVLDWAAQQGLFSNWRPGRSQYDTALILGATTHCMQKRLDYLKDLWKQGVRFKEVAWLTGDRPLDPRVDHLTEQCRNESEAAILLWESTELPSDLRALPVHFVATPMKREGKRPNTEDTLISWLAISPIPGSALFISDQPFCGYQFAIINSTLPSSYDFDVVGPGREPSHPLAAAITLDSIARWLYQEQLTVTR